MGNILCCAAGRSKALENNQEDASKEYNASLNPENQDRIENNNEKNLTNPEAFNQMENTNNKPSKVAIYINTNKEIKDQSSGNSIDKENKNLNKFKVPKINSSGNSPICKENSLIAASKQQNDKDCKNVTSRGNSPRKENIILNISNSKDVKDKSSINNLAEAEQSIDYVQENKGVSDFIYLQKVKTENNLNVQEAPLQFSEKPFKGLSTDPNMDKLAENSSNVYVSNETSASVANTNTNVTITSNMLEKSSTLFTDNAKGELKKNSKIIKPLGNKALEFVNKRTLKNRPVETKNYLNNSFNIPNLSSKTVDKKLPERLKSNAALPSSVSPFRNSNKASIGSALKKFSDVNNILREEKDERPTKNRNSASVTRK